MYAFYTQRDWEVYSNSITFISGWNLPTCNFTVFVVVYTLRRVVKTCTTVIIYTSIRDVTFTFIPLWNNRRGNNNSNVVRFKRTYVRLRKGALLYITYVHNSYTELGVSLFLNFPVRPYLRWRDNVKPKPY